MRGHHRVHAGIHGFAKRRQIDTVQLLPRLVVAGQADVAVLRRIAVAGKVLCGNENGVLRIRMRPLDVCFDKLANDGGIFAVGANVDDGIVRVAVDVGDGGEDPVQSEGAGLAGGGRSFIAGRGQIVRGGEGHVLGPGSGSAHAHCGTMLQVRAGQ